MIVTGQRLLEWVSVFPFLTSLITTIIPGLNLLRKIKIAIPQMAKHHCQWQELTTTLDSGQISEWQKDIEKWENNPLSFNPYRPRTKGMTLIKP